MASRVSVYLHHVLAKTMAFVPRLPQRQFSTPGYVRLDSSEKIEEEELPLYVPKDHYPVHIGEVLCSDTRWFPSLDIAHLPLLGFVETSSKYVISVRWEHV